MKSCSYILGAAFHPLLVFSVSSSGIIRTSISKVVIKLTLTDKEGKVGQWIWVLQHQVTCFFRISVARLALPFSDRS